MELTVTNIVYLACCAFVLCCLVANVFVLYVFYRFKTIRHRPSSASLISLTLFDLLMCASTIFLFLNRIFEDVQMDCDDVASSIQIKTARQACNDRFRCIICSVLTCVLFVVLFCFVSTSAPTVLDSPVPLMAKAHCVAHRLWPSYFLTLYLTVSEILAVALVVLYCMARYKLHAHNAQFLADRQNTDLSSVHQTKREQENKMSKCILWAVTPYLCLFSAPCTIMMLGLVTNMAVVVTLAGSMMAAGALINSAINVFVYCWKLPDFKSCVMEALGKKPMVQNAAAAAPKPLAMALNSVSNNVKRITTTKFK